MPNDNNTTTRFKVDIAELKKEFTEAKRQIQLVNSEFKAATGGMDDWAKSADGLSAKLKQLDGTLEAQKKQLESLEKQYALVVKEQGADSKGAEDLMIKINNQKAAIGNTEKQIRDYNGQLETLGTDTTEATEDTGKLSDGFTVMKGVLANLVSTGIKALIDGLKDVAKAAKEAYDEFDTGYDTLIKATGATGDSAKAIEENYKNVAKSVRADMNDIGAAVGEVSTRFGYTGEKLEGLSEKFLKFADINSTDVVTAVDNSQKAMSAYGLSFDEAEHYLDLLTKTAQDTGVSTDKLNNGIISNATAFKEMGLNIDQAVSFMGQLEKSGANSETVLNGMRKALKNSAENGTSLNDSLMALQKSIKSGTDSTAALTAAYDLFGKSGDQIYGAIKNGTLSFDALTKAAADATGTVDNTYEQTQDAFDKISLAAQGLKVDMATAFKGMLNEYGSQIDSVTDKITKGLTGLIAGEEGAADMLAEGVSDIIKTVLDKVVDSLPEIISVVTSLVVKLAESLLTLAPKFIEVASRIVADLIYQVGYLLRMLFEAIKNELPNALNSLLDAVPRIVGALIDVAKAVALALPDVIEVLTDKLPELVQKAADILVSQSQLIIQAVAQIFNSLVSALPRLLPKIITALMSMINSVAGAITDLLPVILDAGIQLFEGIVAAIPEIIPLIAKTIPDIINTVVKFLTKNVTTIANAGIKLFMALLDALPVVIGALAPEIPKIIDAIVHTLLDNIPVVLDAFVDIFDSARVAFLDFVSRAPEWLESVLEPINDYLIEPVKNAFSEVFDWLENLPINDMISDFFMSCEETISAFFSWVSGIIDGIKEVFSDAWENIEGIWDVVIPYFKMLWENIKAIFSVVKDTLGGFFSSAWTTIKVVWDNVVNYFKTLWDNIKLIFSAVKSVLSGDFSGAWGAIKGIWDNTKAYFSGVWDNVKKVFSTVTSFFREAFSNGWNAVKSVFSNVGEFFGGLWGKIVSKFSTIGTKIGDAIGGAFKTAINAVIATVEKGLNLVPHAINGAIDLINELPGVDISPMSDISLPRLARGGVLKRGQVGLLEGNGAEAVVPLDKNDAWLDEIARRLAGKMSPQGGNIGGTAQSVTNNFYQTNTSPKALSRLDIYRQSKNLLGMKG